MRDELHKLFTGLSLTEGAGKVTRGGEGVLLLDPTHLHTHVLSLDDDDDTEGVQCLVDTVLDLGRQTLLYLKATGEDIHDTG